MRRDPSEPQKRITQVDALEYFTDREEAIQAFERNVNAAAGEPLRVLVFYGVGGIGKTTLVQKLCANLRDAQPPLPHAHCDIDSVGDKIQAYRNVLLRLRSDLESNFGVKFPRFDLCLAVMMAREGGEPPRLVNLPPMFGEAFKFFTSFLPVPTSGIDEFVKRKVSDYPAIERWVRRVGGTDEVIQLRERAVRDDQTLPDELIRRFAQDLQENLPARAGKACRGALFLDAYEALWVGREAGASAQARLLDEWVRTLAEFCLGVGVLLVISGCDRLMWADDDPDWNEHLDQHLLGGLSPHDAQLFLSRCGVGPPPNEPVSRLQRAIINCCNEEEVSQFPNSPISQLSCHPFYLALCVEIVLNTRAAEGSDPPPETFTGIPTARVAQELADRFLKSLHNRAMEIWVEELSLTPRFDEQATLALDAQRQHHNGRAGWEQLTRFSFVERQPDGFYRLHKTMRDALRTRVADDTARTVHQWFQDYWTQRKEPALLWYHAWSPAPAGALDWWQAQHQAALKETRIAEARFFLTYWSDVALDEFDRRVMGDQLWAWTHGLLGNALWETPFAPRAPAVTAAIEHYQSALRIFTEADFPLEWAAMQNGLGIAYLYLPIGDRRENLRHAIACFQAALRVYTEVDFPQDWATTQNNLGEAYRNLPTGDRGENLKKAVACYQASLRVHTEANFPQQWAMTQTNLGNVFCSLLTGDRGENLKQAIACYQSALRVYTEADFPQQWAETQNNLGAAYADLPTGDHGKNLQQAIACYQAALRIFAEADFPYRWAGTQTNLGSAYSDLPTGDDGENLRQAIAFYQSALRVYTEANFPEEWARTQFVLGRTIGKLARVTGDSNYVLTARECLAAAARGYASIGLDTEAAKAADWVAQMDAALAGGKGE